MKKLSYYGTIGPACCDRDTLVNMFRAGMNGVRLNLSHSNLSECEPWLENLFASSTYTGSPTQLLIDLQGRELRCGITRYPFFLEKGQEVFLGNDGIPVPDALLSGLQQGMMVLLDNASIKLEIISCDGETASCRVINGGVLRSRKSISVPGNNITMPILTENDIRNISLASECGVTGVMLPYVTSTHDLNILRSALDNAGCGNIRIFAKIENTEGINKLETFFHRCDEIVIDRGDMGNLMPFWEFPGAQKRISASCLKYKFPFMISAQLLSSMCDHAVPTKSELLDIYNAVLDGASSLMLTSETAIGCHPVKAMEYLVKTAEAALSSLRS